MRACKPLPYGQLTTALVQSSTVTKGRETFCVSFVLIRFVIDELLSEVGDRVGHGLVLAWFESYVLRLVFSDISLQSPGQEKHFGIFLSASDNGSNGQPSMHGFRLFFVFFAWTTIAPRKRERNILVPFPAMYALWFSS